MARRRIRSQKHAERRRQLRRRQLTFYSACIVFMLALLVGLSHLSAVQIQAVHVDTGPHIKEQLTENLVESVLDEPWLGVVSQNNILLLPRDEIRQKLQAISPRIKAVQVNVTGLQEVAVTLINRKAAAQVCVVGQVDEESSCKLVDKQGFIFASASTTASSTSSFTYITRAELTSGSQLLPTTRFQALSSFVAALEEVGMYARKMRIQDYGDVIIPVFSTPAPTANTSSVNLKINMYDDLSQVFSNLQTVLEKNSFVSGAPTSLGETPEVVSPFSLQYIDLRFANKVFYK